MSHINIKKSTAVITISALMVVSINFVIGRTSISSLVNATDTAKSIVYDADTNIPSPGTHNARITYNAQEITNKADSDVTTKISTSDYSNNFHPFVVGGDHFVSVTINDGANAILSTSLGVNNPTSFSLDFGGVGISNLTPNIALLDITGMNFITQFVAVDNQVYDLTSYSNVRRIAINIQKAPDSYPTSEFSIFIDEITASWVC